MPQQINLYDARLRRPKQHFTAAQGGVALFSVLAFVLLTSMGLRHAAQGVREQATQLDGQLAQLRTQSSGLQSGALAATRAPADELQQLRTLEEGQRRVREALASGAAGRTDGYAEYLLALSRQAQVSLWITGLAVSADGDALEITGRMTDPAALPSYLRKLNNEPLFKGRQFARFSLKTVQAMSGAPGTATTATAATEFTLRSKAAGGDLTLAEAPR